MEKRHEEELMELKLQLKQALAEEQQVTCTFECYGKFMSPTIGLSALCLLTRRAQVAEEVDRIKRLLTAERAEKERRDKDLEVTAILRCLVLPRFLAP